MDRSAPCSAATLSLMRISCLRADQVETDKATSIARSPSALLVIVMMEISLEGARGKERGQGPGRGPKAGRAQARAAPLATAQRVKAGWWARPGKRAVADLTSSVPYSRASRAA